MDFPSLFRKIYKSHIDSSDLYNQEDSNKNPIAEEMQRKLNMESERLRVRLRQELAELQERLSQSPAHLGQATVSMRERLAPLAQELQRSLNSNTQDLCSQLSFYLQSLEGPQAQTEAAQPLYREAFEWMSQTLERSSSKVAQVISDFHTKSIEELQHLKEINMSEKEGAESELWQEMSSRLEQEVSSLKAEARDRVEALKGKLAAALQTEWPQKAELIANMEQFCESSVLQDQAFQARLERLFQGIWDSSNPSLSSSGSSLTDDFTVQLSDLIHDILHSV